jgi:hypothetical protein
VRIEKTILSSDLPQPTVLSSKQSPASADDADVPRVGAEAAPTWQPLSYGPLRRDAVGGYFRWSCGTRTVAVASALLPEASVAR